MPKEADFPDFTGWPWILHWRADAAGVLVRGATHSEAPGGRMTVWLDGAVEVHSLPDGTPIRGGLPSSGATLLVRGVGEGEGCFASGTILEVYDLDVAQSGAQLSMGGFGLAPMRWHPEDTKILVRAVDYTGITDCFESPVDMGQFEMDTATGAATPVADELALMRAWYGSGRLEVRCNGGSILVASATEHEHFQCTGPPEVFAHMEDLSVAGISFGSGFDVEYLGLAGPPLLVLG